VRAYRSLFFLASFLLIINNLLLQTMCLWSALGHLVLCVSIVQHNRYICIHMYTYVCVYIYIYIYIYIYMIYIYMIYTYSNFNKMKFYLKWSTFIHFSFSSNKYQIKERIFIFDKFTIIKLQKYIIVYVYYLYIFVHFHLNFIKFAYSFRIRQLWMDVSYYKMIYICIANNPILDINYEII